jgi:hypothetical protein
MDRCRQIYVIVLATLSMCSAWAQELHDQPKPMPAKAQFFAGVVTELDASHITVSRKLAGSSPEQHTFIINKMTKIGKNLRLKQRVTVRYRPEPDGNIALEISIRTPAKTSHSGSSLSTLTAKHSGRFPLRLRC